MVHYLKISGEIIFHALLEFSGDLNHGGLWLFVACRDLEADAPYDADAARVIKDTDGNVDKIRANVCD